MREEDHWISVKGSDLFAKSIKVSSKDDTVIVFLHDALGSVSGWRDFPHKLCHLLQVNGLIYDRLGHGKSPKNPTPRSIDYLQNEAIQILPEVLHKMGIKAPILIGHSDGGTIAMIYESMIGGSRAIVSMAGHVLVESITRAGVEKASADLVGPPYFDILIKYHGSKARKLVDDWRTVWLSDEFKNWNISKQLSSISCPTLVIQGEYDEYASTDHVEVITKAINGAHELIMENCGHFPHREKEDETQWAIQEFLKPIINQH